MPQNIPYAQLKGPAGSVPAAADAFGASPRPRSTPYNFSAANTGQQIKTGAGLVRGVSINTGVASSTIALYDGTSTAGTPLGTFSAATALNYDSLDWSFTVGLFAVVVGTANITVSYN